MATSEALPDYYAVLQVHPDADREVIEAAYRQLMKKHHPDVAGADPGRVAAHHARSIAINQAFGVLRDPVQRRAYDEQRLLGGVRRAPVSGDSHATTTSAPRASGTRSTSATRSTVNAAPASVELEEIPARSALWRPFSLIAGTYYLLPGAYEWEPGHQWELLAVLLLPVVGILGFCLATGRLSPLVGTSLNAKLLAGGLLVLLAMPLLQQLPRVIAAAGPSALLMSGLVNAPIQQSHLPIWLAWCLVSVLGLMFAARLYIFSVLPTLGVCLLIARSG